MKKCIIFVLTIFTFSLFLLTFSYSADLTLSSDTIIQAGSYTYDTITVNPGVAVLCKGNATYGMGVTFNCYNFLIGTGARVIADSQGYQMGQGPGAPLSSIGGGSYGGYGGSSNAGPIYGSIKTPTYLGSGGGTYNGSGAIGGGAISIFAQNEVRIETSARISANGDTFGGAGGSIYITANTVSGTGKIQALGGIAQPNGVADGGGGRIAVYYQTISLDLNNVTATSLGGWNQAPVATGGTVFLKSQDQTNGTLIIDGILGANNVPIQGDYTFDTVWLRTSYGSGRILAGSNVTATNIYSDTIVNVLRVDGTLNNNSDISVKYFTLEINSAMTFTNLNIKQNGKVSHTANYDAQKRYTLNLTVNNNLTIDSGGAIDVTNKGYPVSCGPGTPKSAVIGGGSYGGKGSVALAGGIVGDSYGSETMPLDLGSGGNNLWGGGGAVRLLVWGTLTLNGAIISDGGGGPNWWAGGSGGSVYVKTPTFTGTDAGAKISASGGGSGYGGGGGRIAVYYDTNTYSGTYTVSGGWTWSGTGTDTGTVYLQRSTFHLVPEIPEIINPSYSSPIPGKRPTFVWTAPRDEENDTLHFDIEITQDSSFASTPVVSASSDVSSNGFRYSTDNGITWLDFPSTGLLNNSNPYKVSYTVQQDLWVGYWYWRVRAEDVDGNSGWSEKGFLPRIIGDLVVRITSPSDSSAVYDNKIKVSGVMEENVSQSVVINGEQQSLSVADNKFSVEADLNLGKNTVMVTGYGVLGNYISDTVTIYRLRVPTSSETVKINNSGGTVRLDDWDGEPANDARVEIGEGVFERDVNVSFTKTESDFPVYEIQVDGRDGYRLKKMIKLVLSYRGMNIQNSDEDKLRIYYWDKVKWQFVGGEVDKKNKTVSCMVNHTSRYTVMVMLEAKETAVSVSPAVFSPNGDGINDIAVFNLKTKSADKAEIRIYDSAGRIVRIISEENASAGISTNWDGIDAGGRLAESGLYVYSVTISGGTVAGGTLVIVK